MGFWRRILWGFEARVAIRFREKQPITKCLLGVSYLASHHEMMFAIGLDALRI